MPKTTYDVGCTFVSLEHLLVGTTVRQLRPRGDTFDSALLAFRQADYDTTIQRLAGNGDAKASLLRARALIRLGLFDLAVGEATSVQLESLSSSEAAEALTLLSLAQIALRTTNSVVDQLTAGRTYACSSGSIVAEAEVEFATAFHFYVGGSLECASRTLYSLLSLASNESPWRPISATTHSLEETRARGYDLLGHIAARENRFAEQANFIYLAFAELDKAETLDHYIETQMLSNLAIIAADRDVEGVYEYARDRVAIMNFPEACREQEFEIRRKIGLCASMRGDHIGALREFRRSSEIAPSRASKIKALIDRSSLAYELNELVFAREESDFALELTRQVDWSDVSSAEIFALLSMAENLAVRDSVEARKLLNLFGECKKKLNPFQSDATDLGFTGRERQADALISRSEGNVERAVRSNLDAIDVFKRVGYVGRAATVAVEIFELTGVDSYLEFAAAYAKKLPQSHLARRVDGHLGASVLTA